MFNRVNVKKAPIPKDRLLMSIQLDGLIGAVMLLIMATSLFKVVGSIGEAPEIQDATANYAFAHIAIVLCAVLVSYLNHIRRIKITMARYSQVILAAGLSAGAFLLLDFLLGFAWACILAPLFTVLYSAARCNVIETIIYELSDEDITDLNNPVD